MDLVKQNSIWIWNLRFVTFMGKNEKLLNGCYFTEKTTKSWHCMKESADNIVIKSEKS